MGKLEFNPAGTPRSVRAGMRAVPGIEDAGRVKPESVAFSAMPVRAWVSTKVSFFWVLAVLFLFPVGFATGQVAAEISEKAGEPAPTSELDKLKTEWEAVREQQVQMIREKQDQLEKLKEEIFSKMKTLKGPAVLNDSPGLEAQKKAFQADRQKFSVEMNRQKEKLRQLQASLDEKAKKLEAERARFEQEKKTPARRAP